MPNFTPAEESALRELAGVAEVIRASLPGTKADAPALRVYALLSPPLEHPATPGEIDRNVGLLRQALEELASQDSPPLAGVAVTKGDVGRLLERLDATYGTAVRLFRGA